MTQDAQYRVNELIEQVAEKRAALIESFIVAYLKQSGAKIEDVELCEQESFTAGKAVIRWWLQPKGTPT